MSANESAFENGQSRLSADSGAARPSILSKAKLALVSRESLQITVVDKKNDFTTALGTEQDESATI